jgi:hypothetical protein
MNSPARRRRSFGLHQTVDIGSQAERPVALREETWASIGKMKMFW